MLRQNLFEGGGGKLESFTEFVESAKDKEEGEGQMRYTS